MPEGEYTLITRSGCLLAILVSLATFIAELAVIFGVLWLLGYFPAVTP